MHGHWTIWMIMRMRKWAKFCLWLLLFQVVTSRQLWFSRSESQFSGMWGFLCSVFPTIGARYLYTAIQLYLLSTGAFTAKWPPKLARAENWVLEKKTLVSLVRLKWFWCYSFIISVNHVDFWIHINPQLSHLRIYIHIFFDHDTS